MRTRSTALATLTLVVTSALVSACGGGGGSGDDGVASLSDDEGGNGGTTSTTLSEEEAEEALLDWAECMRGHGLDVPDPQISEDGGIQITVGRASGDDGGDEGSTGAAPPDRDAFEAAREECGDPPQMGGEFTEEDREEMEANALEFAECMRDNGAPDFPDPDFSDFGPGAGPQRRSSQDGDDEGDEDGEGSSAVIAGPFGEIDLEDPEMAAAFEACQEVMGGPDGGPAIGGGPADQAESKAD